MKDRDSHHAVISGPTGPPNIIRLHQRAGEEVNKAAGAVLTSCAAVTVPIAGCQTLIHRFVCLQRSQRHQRRTSSELSSGGLEVVVHRTTVAEPTIPHSGGGGCQGSVALLNWQVSLAISNWEETVALNP